MLNSRVHLYKLFSVEIGSSAHTAQYMCEQISIVIEEVGPGKVMALCTDNASNMKKAWELLQEKYPGLQCYGCLAHGLNLMFGDGLKIATIQKIVTECTAIIKTIKNSHILLAKFREKQGKKKISLKLPVKTRLVQYYSNYTRQLVVVYVVMSYHILVVIYLKQNGNL